MNIRERIEAFKAEQEKVALEILSGLRDEKDVVLSSIYRDFWDQRITLDSAIREVHNRLDALHPGPKVVRASAPCGNCGYQTVIYDDGSTRLRSTD